MCESLGRTLDNEINELLKALIKKAIDTNIFLSEQAEVAIESMCKFSNEYKIISALLGIALTNKNPLVRAKVAMCYAKIFKRIRINVNKIRDFDKLLIILSEFLSDAAFDVRNNSKEALIAFNSSFPNEIEFEKLLSKSLPDIACKKVLEAIHNKSFQRNASPFKRSAHVETRSSFIIDQNSRTRSIGFNQDCAELETITKITADMQSSE